MRQPLPRILLVASIAIVVLMLDASAVMAQISESDVDAQPGSVETTQLVTSSTEVRRAVVGLLALAFVSGLLMIVYWYKTGQQARERFMRRHGGRHMAGEQSRDEPPHWSAANHPGHGHEVRSRGYGSAVAPAYSMQYRNPREAGARRPAQRRQGHHYEHG